MLFLLLVVLDWGVVAAAALVAPGECVVAEPLGRAVIHAPALQVMGPISGDNLSHILSVDLQIWC